MCEIDVVKYVYLIKNVNLLNIYYLYKINFCKKKKKKKTWSGEGGHQQVGERDTNMCEKNRCSKICLFNYKERKLI
jgi:hypothetical protein